MKIDSSNVGMESARTYRSSLTRKFSVSVSMNRYRSEGTDYQFIGSENMGNAFKNAQSKYEEKDGQNESIKDAAENKGDQNGDALEKLKNSQVSNRGRIREISDNTEKKGIEQIRQSCMMYLWYLFFGKDKASEMSEEFGFSSSFSLAGESEMSTTGFSTLTLASSEEVSFDEYEETNFSSVGTVKTSDGREINFNVDVSMSRNFSQYYRQEGLSIQAMCDPLVINFDNSIAGLSDQKFYFDLDMDGEKEEISSLEKGNGFLALDRNADGIINDGTELFGAKNGDGFADLAQYDEDKNGWIDENDNIYDKLKIWIKNSDGEDILYSLKDKNVGAIYLGNQNTDYMIRSQSTGDLNGAIRKTGVFLYEDGTAGTLSHLDIAN